MKNRRNADMASHASFRQHSNVMASPRRSYGGIGQRSRRMGSVTAGILLPFWQRGGSSVWQLMQDGAASMVCDAFRSTRVSLK